MASIFERLGIITRNNWVKEAFTILDDLSPDTKPYAYYSSVNFKFTDTRIGGNYALNMPSGFTEFADLPYMSSTEMKSMSDMQGYSQSISTGKDSSCGMGAYYSEAIDDNSQLIYLQFGVPAYNGMTSFFTSYYNSEMSYIARTGERPGWAFWVGKGVGYVLTLNPLLMMPFITAAMIRLVMGTPTGRYYSLRPTMGLYWSRATTVINTMALYKGIIDPPFETFADTTYVPKRTKNNQYLEVPAADDTHPDESLKGRENYHEMLASNFPDLFNTDGTINLFSIATRAQRIADKYRENMIRQSSAVKDAKTVEEFLERQRQALATYKASAQADRVTDLPANSGIKETLGDPGNGTTDLTSAENVLGSLAYFNKFVTGTKGGNSYVTYPSGKSQFDGTESNFMMRQQFQIDAPQDNSQDVVTGQSSGKEPFRNEEELEKFISGKTNATVLFGESVNKKIDDFWQLLDAHEHDGGMWLCLRVEYTGQTQYSFSNSTGESDISEKINERASKNRETLFSLSNLKLGDGIISKSIEYATKTVTGFASGFLDQLNLAGVMQMAGTAMVDIQNVWQASGASLPTANYTIKCRPWSGDPLTVFMKQDLPMALMLAAALPMSTGPASYTSPFYCSVYSRGKVLIHEGMITDLSITTGTSNVSNADNWQDIGVDINFSITNMSTIMHAPISDSFSLFKPFQSLTNALNGEGPFLDMMQIYSGLSLNDTYYGGRKLNLAINRFILNYKSRLNMDSAMMNIFGDHEVSRFFFTTLARNAAIGGN